jgi:7,8-dihydropterin-6-yl-methyl-4-(beta-D-ribofuranosyl)aminobenzene 5'-phosphate synthase
MLVKIVVDNNTLVDQFYKGEPAASFYIEIDDLRILLDTGYSDIVLSNAEKMGIDLSKLTHIVLSHGHNDHTNGLKYLDDTIQLSKVTIISHSGCFNSKMAGNQNIGAPFSKEEIENKTEYIPTDKPYFLSENCVFLGEIPQRNEFEQRSPLGKVMSDGKWEDDYLTDDSALALKTSKGLFLISSCSHGGICNTLDYAKEICKEDQVAGILGGFHLLDVNERFVQTLNHLENCHVDKVYPCHCISLLAKAKMMDKLPVHEVGVGLTIEI